MSPAAVTTPRPTHDDRGPRRGRFLLAVLVGGLMSGAGTCWIVVGRAQLGTVLLTQVGLVNDTVAPTPAWEVMTAVTAVGLLLLAGPVAEGHRVDRVQLLGAVWTLVCAAFLDAVTYGIELTGPATACVYARCWPGRYQDLAIAGPLLVASLSMLGLACLAGRLPRWSRALVPAVVFGALAVLQLSVWDSVVLPVLSGPPPH